jgi:hypothetical protein
MKLAIEAKNWEEFYNPNLYEAGFQFFVYLMSRIFRDPQWIIVISSAIYVGAVCRFIYKNSDDVVMSIVMYVALDLMTFQMQGMRQAWLARGIGAGVLLFLSLPLRAHRGGKPALQLRDSHGVSHDGTSHRRPSTLRRIHPNHSSRGTIQGKAEFLHPLFLPHL